MDKSEAIARLGGTVQSAAKAIGISKQAISQWPAVLPPRLADRVHAAMARREGVVKEVETRKMKILRRALKELQESGEA